MAVFYQMEFERKVVELEKRIDQAQQGAVAVAPDGTAVANGTETTGAASTGIDDLNALRQERDTLLVEIYANLGPWDTVRVARHPNRPQGRDYINALCRDFCELHGDRRYGDDPAMVTGFGRIDGIKCLIVALHDTNIVVENIDTAKLVDAGLGEGRTLVNLGDIRNESLGRTAVLRNYRTSFFERFLVGVDQ